jgi:hypothetical protein
MALDSPVLRDGDAGFLGYASRVNPLTLPPGMLQVSENMRLDRGVAQTRKGAKRLADDIAPGSIPLTVPFVLLPAPNEPIVQSNYTGGIFASSIMRSPDETNTMEVIVLAGPDRAFTFLTDGSLATSAVWSDGVLGISEDLDGIAEDTLTTATTDGDEIVISKLPASIAYPTGPDETIETTDKVSMLQAFDRLYLLREASPLASGYEMKYTSTSGIAVAGTTATVNFDAAHGYPAGARVRIEGSTTPAFDGHEFAIVDAAPSGNTSRFTIDVPSGTASHAAANIKVRRVKPPLYWTGDPSVGFVRTSAGVPNVGVTYKRLRSTGWANYINNRLVVADGKQNVMISDVLDPDTFDVYWRSFRVGVGGSDFIVGVHPWVEGKVLIFCRKSIWLADIQQYPSPDGGSFTTQTGISNLTMLTDEIGCSARRSITTAGSFIYFLSDSGVYRLDSRLDLKLRGDTKPLSDSISDQISDINYDLVSDSVGFYFNNRYYIAVPLSGADTLNGVFIYNQLNEQWETKDIYGFGVDNYIVRDYNNERRIFISNQAGKLMLLDELDGGDDPTSSNVTDLQSVTGKIKTRRFDFRDMHSKRFLRTVADVVIPSGASIETTVSVINPDSEESLGVLTNDSSEDEDYNMKWPIRQRAHAAEVIYETSNGRPEIRSATLEASPKAMPSTETRNAA